MHERVDVLLRKIDAQMEYNTYIRAVAAQFGSRLIVTQDQVRQMQRGVVPFEIYTMVNDGLELRPGHDLSRYNLPRNEDMQDEQFHLLVLLMLEEPRVQPTWKPEEPFIPALLDARLAFVGREAAVETLQDVHFGNATRRKQKVPLADSPRGFGKTEFAHHYVDQCKKTLKSGHFGESTTRYKVLKELSNCRTIVFNAHAGQFVGKSPLNEVVNRALAKAITEKLEPGTAPLMTFTDSAKDFLVGIVNDLGPLFIVVDDMDRGVLDTMGDSADSQQLFLQLYNCVWTQWIATPKVYFLLLAQARFSRMIGWTPRDDEYVTRPYDLVRLPFDLFGRSHIKAILEETPVYRDGKRSLPEHWELTSQLSVEEAVDLVLTASSGHPSAVLEMLFYNSTLDAFRQCVDKGNDVDLTTKERTELYRNVLRWQRTFAGWVGEKADENPTIDLTLDMESADGDEVSPILVLRRCHLSWEGTLEQARVFAHRAVWIAVVSVLRPLREYAVYIGKVQPITSLDPAHLFKWALLKRFQQLLSGKMALPSFFGKTTLVDDFEGEWLPAKVYPLPEITKYVTRMESPDIGLWVKTVHKYAWPKMEIIIHKLGDGCPCLCLMPQEESWSVDVLFVAHTKVTKSNMRMATKRQKLSSSMRTLALDPPTLHIMSVGVSVMHIRADTAGIIEECKKFEAMFINLGELDEQFGKMTHILVICTTKYSEEVQRQFSGNSSTRYRVPMGCPHITEVLLLGLTTERLRQEFFGFENEPELMRNLGSVLQSSQ